jgi:hypothetical protein
MILFFILKVLNSTIPNKTLFDYRFEMGAFPVNVLDVLLLVLFVQAVFTTSRNKFQAERVHPLFYWSLGLLIAAIFFGIAGAAIGGTGVRQYVTALRNLATLPASIFIGYTLLKNPQRLRTMTRIWLLGSVASAIVLLFLIRQTGEMVAHGKSFDDLRLIRYGGDTGLAAAGLFAFVLVSRIRLQIGQRPLPTPVVLGLFLLTVAGVFAPPHRGAYVTGAAILMFSALVLPRVPVGRRFALATLGGLVIGSTLFAGAVMMSHLTGRDFKTYVIEKRLKQLAPWLDEETKVTVTGTRLPGIIAELKVWAESPLIGQGFAISTRVEAETGEELGMNHNVWTSALAQYGPVGFFAFAVPIIGAIVVGWRMVRAQTNVDITVFGALAAITGMCALIWATLSLSINQQRLAMLVGLMFGMAFRCRAMQLTLAKQQAELEYGQAYDEYAEYDQNYPSLQHSSSSLRY